LRCHFFLLSFYPSFSKRITAKVMKNLDSSQEKEIFTAESAESAEKIQKLTLAKKPEDAFCCHSESRFVCPKRHFPMRKRIL